MPRLVFGLAPLMALPLVLAMATPGSARGTYRVQANVRMSDVPLLTNLELRGDVVLSPGTGPRAVQARLAAQGQACELAGTLSDDGALTFDRGQRCTIVLDDPGATGRVDATLRSGDGRVEDGRIAFALQLDLAGMVHLAPGRLPRLGREASVPIGGNASVRAEGWRDNSRAADR